MSGRMKWMIQIEQTDNGYMVNTTNLKTYADTKTVHLTGDSAVAEIERAIKDIKGDVLALPASLEMKAKDDGDIPF